MDKKEFYSVKEVAEMHGLKEGTIRQFIKRGQLEAVKFSGVNMITQDALRAWESTRKPRKRATK